METWREALYLHISELAMHLFKSRQRTPVEIVHRTRHLLLKYDQRKTTDSGHSGKCKREEEKMAEELSENMRELKLILYSPIAGAEPAPKACAELTEEIFRENTLRLVIMNLPKLTLEARRDATYIVVNLQRQKVHSRLVASDFLEANLDLMDVLVQGYDYADTDESLAVLYGNMLRECTRHQTVARYVLESQQHMKKLFGYIQLPKFEIAADAATTFEQLMTRHRSTVADFMSKNYDWFFSEYNKLMESTNYATRLQAVKLLGDMLQHHSNSAVTTRYVSSKENLRVVMNLLREPSKNIDVKAVRVFKLFAANQKKPEDIVAILVANRAKLLKLLAEFKADKNDEDQFEADKARVVTDITALKPREIELSCVKLT